MKKTSCMILAGVTVVSTVGTTINMSAGATGTVLSEFLGNSGASSVADAADTWLIRIVIIYVVIVVLIAAKVLIEARTGITLTAAVRDTVSDGITGVKRIVSGIAESVYDKWLKMLLNFSNNHESVVKACLNVGACGNKCYKERRKLLIEELDKEKDSYEVLYDMLRKRYEASKYDGLVCFVHNLFHIATSLCDEDGFEGNEAARKRVKLFISVLLKKGQLKLSDTGMKRLDEFFCGCDVEEAIYRIFDDETALAGFLELLNSSEISDDDWQFILAHYLKGINLANYNERIFFANALGAHGFTELLVNVGKAGGTVKDICSKLYSLYYSSISKNLRVSERRRLIKLFVQECAASISKSDEGFKFSHKGRFYSSSPHFDINSLFDNFYKVLNKKVLNVDKGEKEKTSNQLSEGIILGSDESLLSN